MRRKHNKGIIVMIFLCTYYLSYVILFATNSVYSTSCSHGSSPKIVGGHDACLHSHPYVVSLQIRFFWVRAHICGGTLLNEKWVLTAAHCVKESWIVRWLPMDVVAGTNDVDNYGPTAQINKVEKRIPHPLYKGGIGPYDIALLFVRIPFEFTKAVKPVRLPTSNQNTHDRLTLTGWGVLRTTYFFPDLPSKLQEVNVTYLPIKDCYDAIDKIKEIGETNPLDSSANICSGPLTGGTAACNGDSGGPLIQYEPYVSEDIQNDRVEEVTEEEYEILNNEVTYNKQEESNTKEVHPVILGVVSWGISPCGEKGAPTVYTKVSEYLDFISDYVN